MAANDHYSDQLYKRILQDKENLQNQHLADLTSQIDRDRRAQFRRFVGERAKQESIITMKENENINREHENRVGMLKKEREILDIKAGMNRHATNVHRAELRDIKEMEQSNAIKNNEKTDRDIDYHFNRKRSFHERNISNQTFNELSEKTYRENYSSTPQHDLVKKSFNRQTQTPYKEIQQEPKIKSSREPELQIFNNELRANIHRKWVNADIPTKRTSGQKDQLRASLNRSEKDSLNKYLHETAIDKDISFKYQRQKDSSAYQRQRIAEKEWRLQQEKLNHQVDHINSTSKYNYEDFVTLNSMKLAPAGSSIISNKKSVSFDAKQNRYQSNNQKLKEKSKSLMNSKSKRSSKEFTNGKSRVSSVQSVRNKGKEVIKKNLKTRKNKPKYQTYQTRTRKNSMQNRSKSPSPLQPGRQKNKRSTLKQRSFFDIDTSTIKRSPKPSFNHHYRHYRDPALLKIQNRLRVSEVVYEDSKFKNIKHELDHLFHTYNNEINLRNEMRYKIGMQPDIMKRHKLVK